MDQYRAGFEDADGNVPAAIQQGWNLGIRIYTYETRTELIAFANVYQPGVILRPGVTARQQLLQHHRHFHTIGRSQ
jgi:hypothetical protein